MQSCGSVFYAPHIFAPRSVDSVKGARHRMCWQQDLRQLNSLCFDFPSPQLGGRICPLFNLRGVCRNPKTFKKETILTVEFCYCSLLLLLLLLLLISDSIYPNNCIPKCLHLKHGVLIIIPTWYVGRRVKVLIHV